MISDKQKQSVATGGVAVQSGHDTTINAGVSADQMRQIIECVADQLPKYAAVAATLVEARLKEFEERIVSRMESDSSAKAEAFQDPDFQYLLRGAQHSYARSGEQDVAEQLTELIAERSKASGRSRKALSLNRAIETAPLLTENEIAELPLMFALRYIRYESLDSPAALGTILSRVANPFLDLVSTEQGSYIYMESLGCGKISIGSCDLDRALGETYREILGDHPDLSSIRTSENADLIDSLSNAGFFKTTSDGKVLQVITDENEFIKAVGTAGFTDNRLPHIHKQTRASRPSGKDIMEKLEPSFPNIHRLFELWETSPMKNFELSSVGMVIGYINLKRTCLIDSDIDIWIN